MEQALLSSAYLIAGTLFILSLRGLSSQETAKRGNYFGMIGMLAALIATLLNSQTQSYWLVASAIGLGALIGTPMALKVAMTAMPEMVALLHSFVGAAAVLVGFASYFPASPISDATPGAGHAIHLAEIYVAVVIGAITFTGSVIAFLKLRGTLGGQPLLLPGRHLLNLALLSSFVVLGYFFLSAPGTGGATALCIATAVAGVLGIHLVVAIGGADMPVVVSLLNSYSGWTASAAGFMLSNELLIITGALVGSSGAILSYIMCRAMNRSIWNVVFGGFGAPRRKAIKRDAGVEDLEVREADVGKTVDYLLKAKSVIVVPGYGLAVARAQHAVREVTEILRKRGTNVRFGIHPVAGRLPGHMNVLLAEASVPYEKLFDLEEINAEFANTDVSLVIGANDVVNPAARSNTTSPIYGMPILDVDKSKNVLVVKRGKGKGFAGIENELFFTDNTRMVYGDAQDVANKMIQALKRL
jgi:NAD(P) transhydrogenase subunit beta